MIELNWTPAEAEAKMYQVAQDIEAAAETFKESYAEHLKTDREYDRAVAQAYLEATGTQKAREYQAELNPKVISARDGRDVAEVAYKYATARAKALSQKLDAYRSINSSVRQAGG